MLKPFHNRWHVPLLNSWVCAFMTLNDLRASKAPVWGSWLSGLLVFQILSNMVYTWMVWIYLLGFWCLILARGRSFLLILSFFSGSLCLWLLTFSANIEFWKYLVWLGTCNRTSNDTKHMTIDVWLTLCVELTFCIGSQNCEQHKYIWRSRVSSRKEWKMAS